ncbi:MFS transporter [Streptomyces sp. NPDC006333]|uniref:MFS transporter n=1 Tax=Streptomyces sp. NPDC006333 TaxID=3156753 RepID=UPI0033A5B5B3
MPLDARATFPPAEGRTPGFAGKSGPLGTLSRHRDFRRLFIGNAVSLLGSSVTTVALPLTAVVYLHASPAQMGLLGAVALLPHLLLGLPAGVWVDRGQYRRTLVATDAAQTVLLGSLPVLAAVGMLRIWQLYAVVTLAGVANLFETVTAQSLTPHLVPREELLPANSALMLSNTTVNTTGSALGGLLVTLFSAPAALLVDAVSFLISGLCKARIRHPEATTRPPAPRGLTLRTDIAAGLHALFSHRLLRPVILAGTVGAFAGQIQAVALVLFMVHDLALPSALVGAAVAVSGAAGVLGASAAHRLTARVGPGPAFVGGMTLSSLAGFVLACATGPVALSFSVLLTAQLLRGAGPSVFGINQQTLRQSMIAPALLSRANATWRFLVYGGQSLGALLGGLLGTVLGLRATLVVSGCLMLAGTGIAFLSPLRGLRELPERSEESTRPPTQAKN